MATLASPTPVPVVASANEFRRPAARQTSRAAYSHSNGYRSPVEAAIRKRTSKQSSGDSSDEDDLAPIKLSAEAQAILGEDNSQAGSDKENVNIYARQTALEKSLMHGGGRSAAERLRTRTQINGSPAPRISNADIGARPALTTVARDGSFKYRVQDKSTGLPAQPHSQSRTPPKANRVIRVSTGRRSSRSPPSTQSAPPEPGIPMDQALTNRESAVQSPERRNSPDEDMDIAPSTIAQPRRTDENAAHSTMRVRRIGVGSMLGKPIRRGMIRRPSEDDQHWQEASRSPEVEIGRRAKEPDLPDYPDLDFPSQGSPRLATRALGIEQSDRALSPLSIQAPEPASPIPITFAMPAHKAKPTPASNGSLPSTRSSSSHRKPIFKVPTLTTLPPEKDRENEPPPTFKKSKPSAPELQVHEDTAPSEEKPRSLVQPTSNVSPPRQPLAAISHNTPHRPAPAPPPKMSLLEAATSASTARKPKSSHVIINNRTYRRLDCIGRGGSSRVYRVMADNFKIFALKRVNLDDADISAIAGYKGEIDLLRKLENEDRVIRLFDFEINEDKCVLNELMELGETDFNKMLNEQLKSDNAKLDVTFTRYYWKEMLSCVSAVHAHGVVHSDLKPANFLLVKGQLKLIDFGIANAIQDNTVNVHRENQIGTPNYMSPESLICQSVVMGPGGEKKDIKLGKPSDVWSLGCILYQMTYGQPPFAHIQQQMQRIMAIPNPKVEISFPNTGVGGTVVPFGLIKTLRRCLTREVSLRPTISDLLSESDNFLFPVAISPDMLGRVIGNVVGYCRRREENMKTKGQLTLHASGEEDGSDPPDSCLPKDDDMRGWPLAFYEKLRQAQEEGSAW